MRIARPGLGTMRLYVWLVLASPVLLLVASVALTAVGLVADSDGVAAIGALGVVASLILPRMRGTFEFGPRGMKGGLFDDLFDEVVRRGMASGLSPEEATDVAEAAQTEIVGSMTTRPTNVTSAIADVFVQEAMAHEAAVANVIRGVADQRGWKVIREAPVTVHSWQGRPLMNALTERVDFAIETPNGLVLVETTTLTSSYGNKVTRKRWQLAEVAQASGATAAFVVVPDTSNMETPGEQESVTFVKLSELESALRGFE